jgi:uncharacterized membrane protein
MNATLAGLIAATVTFVGTHFVLSHPLRAPLVRRIGEKGFQGLYSIVALASFAWVVLAFQAMPGGSALWNGQGDILWALASLLMLIAAVLLAGSFAGNPALPAPGAADLAGKAPHGVFLVTRHPMMWSFALWGVAHVLISPTPRVIVLAGAIVLLALIGSRLQDRKKRVAMGKTWAGWEAQTSFWPRLARLGRAGGLPWAIGIVLWLTMTWAHLPLAYVPAGIWRWIG